jgi:hypothetical protein
MLVCHCFGTRAGVAELIDYEEDCLKSHEYTALSLQNLRRE